MKKCSDCNIELVDDFQVDVDQHFEIGASAHSSIKVLKFLGDSDTTILGIKIPKSTGGIVSKAAVCPKCGKVEFYIDPTKLNKNN